jgi:hypothetical protein
MLHDAPSIKAPGPNPSAPLGRESSTGRSRGEVSVRTKSDAEMGTPVTPWGAWGATFRAGKAADP